jgi:hypothetical protein
VLTFDVALLAQAPAKAVDHECPAVPGSDAEKTFPACGPAAS